MAEGGLLAWRWLGAALCAAALLSGLAAAQSATGGEKLNREQVEQLMRAEDAALLRHLEGAANLDSVKLARPPVAWPADAQLSAASWKPMAELRQQHSAQKSAHQSTTRRGLHTTRRIAAGQEIAWIAFNRTLSIESALQSKATELLELLQHLVENKISTDTRSFLALHLLCEVLDHPKSSRRYNSYLRTLPAQPQTAVFWSDEQVAELQAPRDAPIHSARTDALNSITRVFEKIKTVVEENAGRFGALFPKGGLDLQWWYWAYGSVLSRAFTLRASVDATKCDAAGNCDSTAKERREVASLALVPVFDEINHANPPHANAKVVLILGPSAHRKADSPADADVGIDDEARIALVALRDLAADEEVLLSLGGPETPMTNTELLVHYGMSLHANRLEGVALSLDLESMKDDPLLPKRKLILERNALEQSGVVRLDGEIPPRFFHALRARELSAEDVSVLERFNFSFDVKNGFFSLQNEMRTHVQLLASLEILLSQFPTTLVDDLKLLNSGALLGPELPPVAYRIAVKRVIHTTILRSFAQLERVFTELSRRWEGDVEKRAEAAILFETTAAGDGGDADKIRNEIRDKLEKWRESIAKWRERREAWRRDWQQWVSEAVEPEWLTLAPANAGLP